MCIVAAGAVVGSTSAHGAGQRDAVQARQLGTGCEPNGLPGSIAVCDGTGRLNVRLTGTAVLSVQDGRVTLKGRAERVCRLKRIKRANGTRIVRRVCSKRAKPILPRDAKTRKARGYTIFTGDRLTFYLPAGNWRVSAEGSGVSLSAVGEGIAGVVSRARRTDSTSTQGLISVGGQVYDRWPRRWTKYEFGPDAVEDDRDDDRSAPSSSGRTSAAKPPTEPAEGTVAEENEEREQDPEGSGSNEPEYGMHAPSEVEEQPTSDAGTAGEHYSSDAQLPRVPG